MKINIKKIATLAKISLTDKEIAKFEPQLEETLVYIEQLNEVATDHVKTTNNVTGLANVMDEDKPKASLTQEEALSNAQEKQRGMFKVKGIFADE